MDCHQDEGTGTRHGRRNRAKGMGSGAGGGRHLLSENPGQPPLFLALCRPQCAGDADLFGNAN